MDNSNESSPAPEHLPRKRKKIAQLGIEDQSTHSYVWTHLHCLPAF